MVLQHAHSFSAVSSPRLAVARTAAGAGGMSVNGPALLLLLIPAGRRDLAAPSDRGMVVGPIVDRIIPPKPPVPVPVVKPVTPVAPATPAPVRPDIVQPVVEQVVVDQGTLQAEETVVPATDAGTGDIAPPAGPVAGMRLQYADAPSPPYPRAALRAGLQGKVMLPVLVDVDGRPLQVDEIGSAPV